MTTPFCFVDTETTGVHPGRRPWEIAIIRRDDQGQNEFVCQIENVELSEADPFGLKVGRFYERHNQYAATPAADGTMPEFIAAWNVERLTRGAHIVGAVPSFDTETLDAMLRRHQLIPAWHHRLRCVESMTAGHLRREVGGLGACAEALGLEVDEGAAHTALGDARLVMRVYAEIMGELP